MKIYTVSQIQAWDKYTIVHEPISSLDLMDRAAGKCAEWILLNKQAEHYTFFCGKGNNGGDGLAIARILSEHQKEVDVYILELGKTGTGDFQDNLSRLQNAGRTIHFIENDTMFPALNKEDVIIDCLYGSGLNRPLEGLSSSLVKHINNNKSTVISIDMPSGMFVDISSIGYTIIEATVILTFQATKLSFLLPENEKFTGNVVVLNIGLDESYEPDSNVAYQFIDSTFARQLYKPRHQFSHKGTYGHALIVAGSKGKMGAAVLASKASLRSGAGLVTTAVPEWGLTVMQTAIAESMAIIFEDLEMETWDIYQAVGVGPGLGTEHEAVHLLKKCITSFKKPIVIDADGLNILSKHPAFFELLPKATILTPHPKEFERLFGSSANNFERLELALQNAMKHQLIIVLKGHHTFIACPDGKGYFNSTGNAGMATGGTGDVLTGIITGMLAQGYGSEHSAILGVYIHGLAGDIAAAKNSQEGLIAGDLIQHLGKAYLELAAMDEEVP